MELKGITREWDSLKKDAAARAASAAPYVKEGKIVDANDAVALLAVINPAIRSTSRATTRSRLIFWRKHSARSILARCMICTWYSLF
ncbi:MAG: hypothetical protein ACLR2G_01330 [Phascolarctobacterium faecium]